MLLVGTKSDLREYETSYGLEIITEDDAAALATDIGARCYVECSALTQEGLHKCFSSCRRLNTH